MAKTITLTCDMTYDEFVAYYNNSLCMGLLGINGDITINNLKFKKDFKKEKSCEDSFILCGYEKIDKDSNVKILLPDYIKAIDERALEAFDKLIELSGDGVEYIGKHAFEGCYRLRSVNTPFVSLIDEYAFNFCISLTKATLENCETIGTCGFYRCYNLKEVIAPKLSSCGEQAFRNCHSITKCRLDSLGFIHDATFEDCFSLKKIYTPNIVLEVTRNQEFLTRRSRYKGEKRDTTTLLAFRNCLNLDYLEVDLLIGDEEILHRQFINFIIRYNKHRK